jgi:hypothetical protein
MNHVIIFSYMYAEDVTNSHSAMQFNPISTEGQSGATKELIRSYYEDPINEWKASKAAVDALVGLATP